jgi:TolA-binding protein
MKDKDIKKEDILKNLESAHVKYTNIKLSTDEKSNIRKNLSEYISKDIPKDAPIKTIYGDFVISHFFSQSLTTRMYVPAIALLTLLLVTGTSYAAQSAIPGDVLYPIKRSFNEPIEKVLAISDRSKAYTELKQASRRLEEVEILSVRGELGEDIAESLEEDFNKKASSIISRIERLEQKGKEKEAADLGSSLEARLESHGSIVAKSKKETEDISISVKSHTDIAKNIRERVEEKVAEKTEREKDKITVEESRQKSEKKIMSIHDENGRGDSAKKDFDEGNKKLESGEYGEAYKKFESAGRSAEKVRLEREVEKKIQKEIRIKERE